MAAAGAGFVYSQRLPRSNLLDLSLFRNPRFGRASTLVHVDLYAAEVEQRIQSSRGISAVIYLVFKPNLLEKVAEPVWLWIARLLLEKDMQKVVESVETDLNEGIS